MSDKLQKFNKWIKDNENKWISAGIITIVCAVAMPITVYFVSNSKLTADSFSKLGTVGDFLGGTTVGLLSLASILFLISTIVMQRKELGMQREELQMTRDELVKANEQYRITNETMTIQRFETTFFNMLQMHNNLVNSLTLFEEVETGKEVFIKLYKNVNQEYVNKKYEMFIKDLIKANKRDIQTLSNTYLECVKYANENLGRDYTNYTIDYIHELMLNVYETVRKSDGMGGSTERTYCFVLSFEDLFAMKDELNNIITNNFNAKFFKGENYKKLAYENIMDEKYYPLNSYFKNVYNLFEFVSESYLSKEEKNRYLTIYAATFSATEITLLQYETALGSTFNFSEIDNLSIFWVGNRLLDSIL